MRTLSPIETGSLRTPRITAVSMITQFAPIVTLPLSAVMTAPKPTDEFGPTVTSPQMTAFGATRVEGSIFGVAPPCSMSIALLLERNHGNEQLDPCGLRR